jgi:hypothetical protein
MVDVLAPCSKLPLEKGGAASENHPGCLTTTTRLLHTAAAANCALCSSCQPCRSGPQATHPDSSSEIHAPQRAPLHTLRGLHTLSGLAAGPPGARWAQPAAPAAAARALGAVRQARAGLGWAGAAQWRRRSAAAPRCAGGGCTCTWCPSPLQSRCCCGRAGQRQRMGRQRSRDGGAGKAAGGPLADDRPGDAAARPARWWVQLGTGLGWATGRLGLGLGWADREGVEPARLRGGGAGCGPLCCVPPALLCASARAPCGPLAPGTHSPPAAASSSRASKLAAGPTRSSRRPRSLPLARPRCDFFPHARAAPGLGPVTGHAPLQPLKRRAQRAAPPAAALARRGRSATPHSLASCQGSMSQTAARQTCGRCDAAGPAARQRPRRGPGLTRAPGPHTSQDLHSTPGSSDPLPGRQAMQ